MAEIEMETGDASLSKAALDGSMDYSAWPELLPTVLARIEAIALTEFPIPNVQSAHPRARPPSPRFLAPLPSSDPFEAPDQTEPSSSQGTNKENADLTSPPAARRASASANPAPGQQQPPATATLPKPVADMLDEILSVLRTNFSQYPPHTIQRLSELVLRPRQHYRNLVPFLHALDRVVHVTSGANTYPLPPALPNIGAMNLLANGGGAAAAGGLSIDTSAANNLGSDDALGGALLTPIPWLARRTNGGGSEDGSETGSSSPLSASGNPPQQFQQQQQQPQRQGSGGGHLEGRVRTESTETIEGPNGMGSIETVSVSVNGIPSTGAGVALLTQRSVTQGELLRQEQRAGLVPLNQLNRQQQQQPQPQPQKQQPPAQGSASGAPAAEEDATMNENPTDEADEEDEVPHARGPEEIGAADTGPQSAAAVNYIASGGSPMDVQGIDVEAAVGRKVQSPPAQQQQTDKDKRASGSPELVAQSPKREAADSLESASPAKRRREDEPGASAGQETATDQQQTAGTNIPSGDAAQEPKRDAEGDVVLPDVTSSETASESKDAQATADSAAATPESKPEAGSTAAAAADDTKADEAAKDKSGEGDATTEKEDKSGPGPASDSATATESQGG